MNTKRNNRVKDIPLIKYKGVIHITGCCYKTDCGIEYPMQGKHLASQCWGDLKAVTCEKCLATLYSDEANGSE